MLCSRNDCALSTGPRKFITFMSTIKTHANKRTPYTGQKYKAHKRIGREMQRREADAEHVADVLHSPIYRCLRKKI